MHEPVLLKQILSLIKLVTLSVFKSLTGLTEFMLNFQVLPYTLSVLNNNQPIYYFSPTPSARFAISSTRLIIRSILLQLVVLIC